MAGPCSPKHCPAYLILLRTFSSRCYATFQKLLDLWLGRSPQPPLSRPSSPRGVEESFRLDVMQPFKKNQIYGCVVLSQIRRKPSHGVEEAFRLDVMQPVKNSEACGWAVFSLTRPSSSHGVKESSRFEVMRLFKTS